MLKFSVSTGAGFRLQVAHVAVDWRGMS